MSWVPLGVALGLLGCGNTGASKTLETADTAGPCFGLTLPECPDACPDDWALSCGEPCDAEGETCGNTIGDGRTCVDGLWACSVHAPLEPRGCNRTCR